MAIDEILISALPGETRIALLEKEQLVEFAVARLDLESRIGNIYLGRVTKVAPAIAAAFVDAGLARAGFLAAADARPWRTASTGKIADYVGEGDTVMVQATQDAVGDKGVRLTTRVVLDGRFLSLAPGRRGFAFARGIAKEDRERWTTRLRALPEDADGVTVPTAGDVATPEMLAEEINALRALWRAIESRRATAKPPACLHAASDTLERVLGGAGGRVIRRITVDDAATHARVKTFLETHRPSLLSALTRHVGPGDLFQSAGIDEQVDAALAATVPLPSGGTIVIDEAAALVAIDVNTAAEAGRGSAEEAARCTNREAIAAIARALRLRNLSGLIVVDFVPMRERRHRDDVLTRLRQAVAGDPIGVEVVGFTRLGLVEMTRRRTRPTLLHALTVPCPGSVQGGHVKAPATLAFEALRAARREARARPHIALAVRAAPTVIGALEGLAAEARAALEERLGRRLVLRSDVAVAPGGFVIEPA